MAQLLTNGANLNFFGIYDDQNLIFGLLAKENLKKKKRQNIHFIL